MTATIIVAQNEPHAVRNDLIRDRHHQRAPAIIRRRILRRQHRCDRRQFGAGSREIDTGVQPGECEQIPRIALVCCGFRPERNPHLLRFGKTESRRHHANDGVRLAIDFDAPADDARIAVIAALPDFVAEHHDRFGARPVIIFAEGAAEDRLDTESGKQVRRDCRARDKLRILTIGERR